MVACKALEVIYVGDAESLEGLAYVAGRRMGQDLRRKILAVPYKAAQTICAHTDQVVERSLAAAIEADRDFFYPEFHRLGAQLVRARSGRRTAGGDWGETTQRYMDVVEFIAFSPGRTFKTGLEAVGRFPGTTIHAVEKIRVRFRKALDKEGASSGLLRFLRGGVGPIIGETAKEKVARSKRMHSRRREGSAHPNRSRRS